MSSSAVDDADALPEPPADIASRKLPLVARPAGTRYLRIHRATDGAVWFGWNVATRQFRPPINRFDAPDRSYGVLYASVARDGAFAETIGRKPRTFRSNDELAALVVTTLALTNELRLVDLHGGEAVGALGATGVVGVGPQTLARRRSQALHAHPEVPDGIEYRCRHNSDEVAVALFDRVGEASLIPEAESLDSLSHEHIIETAQFSAAVGESAIPASGITSIGVVSLVSDLVWLSAMRARHRILEPPS